MSLIIGLVGKPNSGKSTMLKALTLADVKTGDYPFTTIKPNAAAGYVITDCPCRELGIQCSPQNSECINGKRLVPVNIIDVAGLVPGAYQGKGLGNMFLDDLRQAHALIHVVDASGNTDEEGNKTTGHDPSKDVEFLEKEIEEWFFRIVMKAIEKHIRRLEHDKAEVEHMLLEQLSGLSINMQHIKKALEKSPLEGMNEESIRKFTSCLVKISKPMLIAANKADMESSDENIEAMKKGFPEKRIIPCSAEAELALRLGAKSGRIEYFPGENKFRVLGNVDNSQEKALLLIENLVRKHGSTGVQQCLNESVFGMLKYIVVYPVENENRMSNKKGNVLPDAMLLPSGSVVRDMAEKVHTDLSENFICAIDARTKKRVSAEHELKNNDIIKIVTR